MLTFKKIPSMLAMLCILLGPGADLSSANWRPPPSESDIETGQPVRMSPTTPQNMRPRFEQIMQWTGQLLRKGVNVDAVLPPRDATILRQQVFSGNCRQACPRIDRIYPQMERLALNQLDAPPPEPPRYEHGAPPPPQTGPSQPATPPQPTITTPEPEPNGGPADLVIRQVHLATEARRVRVFRSLPDADSGAERAGEPHFSSIRSRSKNGSVQISVSHEPSWVIEGRLPAQPNLDPDVSPFGLSPASPGENGYFAEARELGASWDKDDDAFAWSVGQPDVHKNRYSWSQFDAYFRKLPATMRALKSIDAEYTVKFADKIWSQHSGQTEHFEHRLTARIDGPDYRRWDPKAYSRWVRAVVERYDGDQRNDMPDLVSPVRHWLVPGNPSLKKEDYADLLRITYRAVKDADPDAKVLTSEMTLPFAGREDTYRQETLALLDAVNHRDLDILALKWSGNAGEWRELPQALKQFRADLAENERRMQGTPIWITRLETQAGHAAKGKGSKSHRQSEKDLAEELVKRYMVALAEGVDKIFWDLDDAGQNDGSGHGHSSHGDAAAYDASRNHKNLSYWAYRKMTEVLQYWDGSPPVKLNMGPDITAIRFPYGKEGKKGIVVIWLNKEHPSG